MGWQVARTGISSSRYMWATDVPIWALLRVFQRLLRGAILDFMWLKCLFVSHLHFLTLLNLEDTELEANQPWRDEGRQRSIVDIWLALKTTAIVFSQITVVGGLIAATASLVLIGRIESSFLLLGTPLIWVLFAKFIFNVWLTYHEGIVINAEKAELSFPATDVENSVLDILTLKRFFDNARRETVRLASVETVMDETRALRGHYAVNVSGSFGSRQFSFDSKQKRDEFRAGLDWGANETGVRARQDRNSDVGGYGG